MMNEEKLTHIVEASLLAAGRPLTLDNLLALFADDDRPDKGELRKAIEQLNELYAERGIEILEVASGYRLQVKSDMEPWVSRLWEERPTRYSRALLETLSLIAYRQPITRGEIEDIRGVSVSSNIVKTLLEREWVRVVGHRDVPGRPAMYSTTREFLDYFNLKGLGDLPPLSELRDIDSINAELDLALPGEGKKPLGGVEGDTEAEDGTAGEGEDTSVAESDQAETDDAADGESEDASEEASGEAESNNGDIDAVENEIAAEPVSGDPVEGDESEATPDNESEEMSRDVSAESDANSDATEETSVEADTEVAATVTDENETASDTDAEQPSESDEAAEVEIRKDADSEQAQ
ncbi:SMC-Scp complex subunit ScpB [Solemya pervernicosa gill symbiont]|uniref:SMC-Scp complex subunit ScpB n=2 Tax=Gammaproteobacteria incertae sedis TaxID=118884 RepID=A0A1T2L6B9_9GAMM|nr:SMC-Scp complex subunit ScpB [Candidatus Reidiella endopervernicosa]OOZ40602.1 SMC-Scp complex subunit ScpB [Solemya pervernicosa gill symbiont]QKQ26617.1 SMC-Scp complex subunit ScpB [Candidatus Reidiella endopervernicosa]